ncbi:PPE family protein [Mycobacterium seoulense]|uniref:Putative PPE family protein PPE45 n=1 Tax=Mycobacterium seoulense TaxID=386911 RepID=A0A7I7P4X7_9MYCO|nr:PPE family protein [Mycobacterium seoulense]MCV7438874.1 PPE family protein [Mycobacterium seoulense]BBY03931.1 putative PPE family protein PPE45 [Mycobacterium seoulense]
MFDFGALPPEINSGRMYTGPGSGPMLAAAAAWDELATELSTAASICGSVLSELTSALWSGPASESMVSAVVPYVSWLAAVANLSEQTANQARGAAAAFDTAYAMTVPPPEIAANRTLLMALIATNFFGQNTPAIAATEAQYMQMWAQDAVAMYGYAGSSAVAGQLTPFTSPPNTTTPDAPTDQATAVAQATATPAGNTAQTTATTTPQLATAISVQQVSSTLGTADSSSSSLIPGPNNWWGFVPNDYKIIFHDLLQEYNSYGAGYQAYQMAQQLVFGTGTTAGSGAWYPTPQFAQLGLGNIGSLSSFSGVSHAGLTAGVGQAGKVGMLSVPQSWATPVSQASPALTATEPMSVHTTSNVATSNGLLRGIPNGAAGRRSSANAVNKYGFRRSVLTRPPSAG